MQSTLFLVNIVENDMKLYEMYLQEIPGSLKETANIIFNNLK